MIENAKYFNFNDRSLSTFEGMRIGTESTSLYAVQIISNRRLIEEKIPGRQAPYFYGVDDDPLTLEITVALEKPKLISELRPFFQWLYNNTEYKELWFDTDRNKIFYAMFIGTPVLNYIEQGTTDPNNRRLIGYITLTARCNAGTAFAPAIQTMKIFSEIQPVNTLFNTGDNTVYTSIQFTTPADRTLISGEGGSAVIRSTADGLREVDNNQSVPNRRLLYDSSKNWAFRKYDNDLIEIETTYSLPGGGSEVEVQMRRIQFSTDEGLYALTPWTKSIYFPTPGTVSSINYKVRKFKTITADSGIIQEGGLFSIRDNTKQWTNNQWIGTEHVIRITSGAANGQVRKIIGNNPNDPRTLLIGENLTRGLSDRWGETTTANGISTTSKLPQPGDNYIIHELEPTALEFGTPEFLNSSRVVFDKDRTLSPNAYANTHLLAIMQPDGRTVRESQVIISNTRNTITVGNDFSFIPTNETQYEIRPIGIPTGGTQVYNYKLPFNVKIRNRRNNDEIFFAGLEASDVIVVDMATRRITAQKTNGIYDKWNRGYLHLETGANNIEVSIFESNFTPSEDATPIARNAQTSMTFIYQPIRYL